MLSANNGPTDTAGCLCLTVRDVAVDEPVREFMVVESGGAIFPQITISSFAIVRVASLNHRLVYSQAGDCTMLNISIEGQNYGISGKAGRRIYGNRPQ